MEKEPAVWISLLGAFLTLLSVSVPTGVVALVGPIEEDDAALLALLIDI